MPDNGSINLNQPSVSPAGTGGSAGAGTATGLAQEYGQKISEVATQARDYVTDKVSVVGEKIKDLQNADLGELAENAKDYSRQTVSWTEITNRRVIYNGGNQSQSNEGKSDQYRRSCNAK